MDERALRQRLHAELDAVQVSPLPGQAVLRRGSAIRTRRRSTVVSGVAALAIGVAVTASWPGPVQPGTPGPASPGGQRVTLNLPDPRAPGGVFASGTADGSPWRLAVRNIAGPAPWCLPAVMLNGRNADVLFRASGAAPAISNPAFLTHIPGRPGIGVAVVQLRPQVTRLVADLPGGRSVSQRPVTVTLCGQRFHLAGFAFGHPQRGITQLTAYSALGQEETLDLPPGTFTAGTLPSGTFAAGVWENLDKSAADNAASSDTTVIGSGRIAGTAWTITTGLGLFGQCYAGAVTAAQASGQAQECLPAEAPPRGASLAWVPFPASVGSAITGYAGLVSPRTATIIATLSDGSTRLLLPHDVAGRRYFALAVGGGVRLARLVLQDSSRQSFAATTSIPAAR